MVGREQCQAVRLRRLLEPVAGGLRTQVATLLPKLPCLVFVRCHLRAVLGRRAQIVAGHRIVPITGFGIENGRFRKVGVVPSPLVLHRSQLSAPAGVARVTGFGQHFERPRKVLGNRVSLGKVGSPHRQAAQIAAGLRVSGGTGLIQQPTGWLP